ncbi:unnamed protein product [Closterium sp. Naga37s-1]|nr:unnamed protein product [Closterium sp. Naga37s-1]
MHARVPQSPLAASARCYGAMRLPPPTPLHPLTCAVLTVHSHFSLVTASLCLHPPASTPTGRQQQKAWRSSGSSVASGRGEWWDDARPGLALLTTALAQPPGSTSATDRGVSEWRCGSRGSVAARRGAWPSSLCLHPSASTPTGRQQQKAWRSSGSSVASGRGEWWDDARPGLALLTTALAQPPGSTSATDRGVSEWRCGSRGSVAARRGAWPFPLPTPLCQHTYRPAAAGSMEEQWEQRGERERRVLAYLRRGGRGSYGAVG